MPSVQVALRLMDKGKHVKAKDVMAFIITGTASGSAEQAAKNAYPQDEVLKTGSDLKPDIDYYLHKQILPPVERLCAPISGTNVTQLADCLGLDTSKYRISSASAAANGGSGSCAEADIQPFESQMADSMRFQACVPLQLQCRACQGEFEFSGMTADPTAAHFNVAHGGIQCPAPGCGALLPTLTVVAQVDAAVRQHVARYYDGWLACDDAQCGARTCQVSVFGRRCLGPKGLGAGCLGRMTFEFSDKALWTQMLYLQSLFDVDRVAQLDAEGIVVNDDERDKLRALAEANRKRLDTVKDAVGRWLDKCGRQWVQMDSLFAFAMKA